VFSVQCSDLLDETTNKLNEMRRPLRGVIGQGSLVNGLGWWNGRS